MKSKLKYVFFWGDTERGTEVTKACLNQWYPSVFTVYGADYSTADQYIMAQNLECIGFAVVFFGQRFKDTIMPTKELMKLV